MVGSQQAAPQELALVAAHRTVQPSQTDLRGDMGTDIRLLVEYRINGSRWHLYDTLEGMEPGGIPRQTDPVYVGRNYVLFGLLAGVRLSNTLRVGHLGTPNDATEEYLQFSRRLAEITGDTFGHGYVTLEELLDFDWLQSYSQDGQRLIYSVWVGEFFTHTLPRLLRFRDFGCGLSDVRCLYFFEP